MPELAHSLSVSRSAYLELQQELRLINDGYEFLDEKRILLAAEILRQREAYREARSEFLARAGRAADLFVEAAADQGLDGLQVSPAPSLDGAQLRISQRPCGGQELLEASFEPGRVRSPGKPLRPSPSLDSCQGAYLEVVAAAAPLAALTANLERLMDEYTRTERRVRALENIVLPEIRRDIDSMEEHLDLNDQEELIRVLSFQMESDPAR